MDDGFKTLVAILILFHKATQILDLLSVSSEYGSLCQHQIILCCQLAGYSWPQTTTSLHNPVKEKILPGRLELKLVLYMLLFGALCHYTTCCHYQATLRHPGRIHCHHMLQWYYSTVEIEAHFVVCVVVKMFSIANIRFQRMFLLFPFSVAIQQCQDFLKEYIWQKIRWLKEKGRKNLMSTKNLDKSLAIFSICLLSR